MLNFFYCFSIFFLKAVFWTVFNGLTAYMYIYIYIPRIIYIPLSCPFQGGMEIIGSKLNKKNYQEKLTQDSEEENHQETKKSIEF